MYVLYIENKERFLQYCDEIKDTCDHMALHGIDVLRKELLGKSSKICKIIFGIA